MSNFAIEGLISGFNTTELIEAILDIQYRGPVDQIQTRVENESKVLASLQAVNANLLNLEIAASSLKSTSLFNAKNVRSSNENIVSASVSSSAQTGGMSIRVDNLAKADQISSDVFVSRTDELKYQGKFILNGRTIEINKDDTLNSIATQINGANVGVKASVIQLAPSQNKLVLSSTSTGVNKIEMREVGTSDILSKLGLITSSKTDLNYDRTVNANNLGALSNKFTPGYTQTYTGETFTVSDAGGQYNLSVTLNGVDMTLQDIADQINSASTAAGANISASVIEDGSDRRLAITSTTGIPQKFTDPNNVLFHLGILGGVQSAAFSSKSTAVGAQLNLGATNPSTITLEDGDGSDSFTFDIDLDTDSLSAIVSKINTQAAAAGSDITANIISADGVSRLELNSATGRFNILADTQNALQTLGIADRTFKHIDQRGENAQLTYNGVTVNRSSNLVTDLEDGVSLALIKESSETVNISITEDLSNVEKILQNYVDAFNALSSFLSEQTYFNAETGDRGILFGNSVIRELRGALSGGISRSIPNLPGVKVADLNGGAGIDLGKIQITDRKGKSYTVDLSGVKTVQEIIDEINYTDGIQVKAEIGSSGTAINLIDLSGGTGVFKVEEVNGRTTAADLGLLKQMYSNNIAGSPIHEAGSQSISSLGISLTSAGTLTFNTNDLQAALNEDSEKVKNLIQATGVGFANYFGSILRQFTAYGTGRMSAATDGIQDKIDRYNKQIKRYEERANAYASVLRKRFTALEVTMSKSQQLSDLLAQKLSNK